MFSFADQALAVGGSFLTNVVLARTQSKEQYGMFALSYSVFAFLSSLHNSTVLEPGTVYAAGRYQHRFSQYLRLLLRINVFVGLLLTALVLLACLFLHWFAPQLVSSSLIGMGVAVGALLSGAFLRRIFYLQREPHFAAQCSFVCFMTVIAGLWLASKAHILTGFSGFLILALGWLTAGIGVGKRIRLGDQHQAFLDAEPGYWREHWKYSKWVLATALVFQLATQAYYWLVAGLLSVKEVGELRAMYLLVSPIDQVFIALSLLLIPTLASHFAAKRMASFLSVWKRFALGIIGMTTLVALLVRIFGKQLMHVVYAGRFDALTPILYLLALLPLLSGIGTVLSGALNSVERPKLVFYAYAAAAATTFLGGIPLLAHFALRGAAYGLLLSGAVWTGVLFVGFVFAIRSTLATSEKSSGQERLNQSSTSVGRPLACSYVSSSKSCAPIALFVYSRPEHTRRSLESLRANDLARHSDLFIFSDGPKNARVAAAVEEVRRYVRTIEGFRSVTCIEREQNLGLSMSIIDGVTRLCNDRGRVIAVEDDVLTAPDFLTFMNAALGKYADEAKIFSVSGFGLPIDVPNSYSYDAFCSYRFMCWGWGTWKDRWQRADWSVADYAEFRRNRELQKRFNRGGNDLTWLLGRHIEGRIDSWDTVWAYTHSRNDAVALLSVQPRAYNIGFDGTGVHCRRIPFRQAGLVSTLNSEYLFPDSVVPDAHLAAAVQRLHHRSLPRQFARYLYDRVNLS